MAYNGGHRPWQFKSANFSWRILSAADSGRLSGLFQSLPESASVDALADWFPSGSDRIQSDPFGSNRIRRGLSLPIIVPNTLFVKNLEECS